MKKIFWILALAAGLSSFQIIKTQMQLTVRNELGNTEEGATVQLFETEDDYKAEKNAVQTSVTDKKGVAKFKDLKAISYFILAKKGDKNNFGGGEQTGKLEEKRINKVTVVIE
ncbi:MAG: hypothetical protein ACOYW3_00150 [Bacteroidota bacterium]